ncbi:protein MIZU-KUSSEI 1-like [Curcuma longa]|uniref:protein MIZU-KUSSEI 1-like n=1 Tax=Curcuma longa TaxID=136217 RepID=UPI003D9DEC9D
MERIRHGSLSSSSSSVRRFRWALVKAGGDGKRKEEGRVAPADYDDVVFAVSSACDGGDREGAEEAGQREKKAAAGSSSSSVSSRFRAAVAGWLRPAGLGPRVTGTLFGRRRGGGHVHVAFQADPRACPAVLIELATPTSTLVREMASGMVRIALECDRRRRPRGGGGGKKQQQLVEEPLWRAYCNGKRCGYAVRRECGPADWRVLRAVEPVSTGAGVLPASSSAGEAGETMYLRAKFERVVGSRDSEAFYMMNPDNDGGPELSIYFLRL